MIQYHRQLAASVLAITLAGCAASPVPRAAPPPRTITAPANPQRVTQNNSLIGRDADSAVRMFGKPRLDISEGAGRKLQFAGSACTIDIYYYTQRQGAAATATHVDARTPDGRDTNVPGCIEALQR